MSAFVIVAATTDDNEELCRLCKIPLKGDIMFTLERSPDFFAGSKIQCENVETYVCRNKANNSIDGVFSVGKRRVFYKHGIKMVRYFSDMRIRPQTQGSRLLYEVVRFMTDHILSEDEVAQAIVFADNEVMLQLISKLQHRSKKMSIFSFYSAGNYISYMVKFPGTTNNESNKYHIKKAEQNNIPAIQQFIVEEGGKKEFYPYYDLKMQGNGYYAGLQIENYYLAFESEKLVGITAVWNQHSIKQTRIYDYSLLYKISRPFINLYGFLSNGFALPPKGTILKYLTIHTVLVRNNSNTIFESILKEIAIDCSKMQFNYFLVGFDEKDNLNRSIEKLRNKRKIKGRHFLISKNKKPGEEILNSLYYLETARL